MNAYMPTDKPLISILMAVYEPRMDWLKEQLDSLEAQTYPNLKIYICDDGSQITPFSELAHCVKRSIRSFPYELWRNEENLGSNQTFERLTYEAEGEYFAYCDQDDIWKPDKLSALTEILEGERAQMAYCDMSIIDPSGSTLAESLKKIRPRLRYLQGTDLSELYFFRNCTAGCSMLIRSSCAKAAIPFPSKTVCDQWLAIVASIQGRISFLPRGLVQYRQHGGNQTGILNGIIDSQSYRKKRLLPLVERMEFYRRYAIPSVGMEKFLKARIANDVLQIWNGRKYSYYEAILEILMGILPQRIVDCCFRRLQ